MGKVIIVRPVEVPREMTAVADNGMMNHLCFRRPLKASSQPIWEGRKRLQWATGQVRPISSVLPCVQLAHRSAVRPPLALSRRKYQCPKCDTKNKTWSTIATPLSAVHRDNSRDPSSPCSLRRLLARAVEDPVIYPCKDLDLPENSR